jgi:hypothetical protein
MNKPLSTHFNAVVQTMANRVLPTGFDVGPDAPHTFEGLQAHYDRTGRIKVWDGASSETIFGDAEINYAFRAWHDAVHLKFALPFTFQGECAVADIMKEQVRKVYGDGAYTRFYCNLIECEVVAQADHFRRTGEFPADQVAFTRLWLNAHNVANPFTTTPDNPRMAA